MSTNAEHRRHGLTGLAQALPPAVAAAQAAAGPAPGQRRTDHTALSG